MDIEKLKQAVAYLETVEQPLRNQVFKRMVSNYLGLAKPLVSGCNPDNCHGNTGCSQHTPFGDCECVGVQCQWVPDIGPS